MKVYEGKSNQQIADEMFVTIKAPKFHLTSIYKKLGITKNRRAGLILHIARLMAGVQ